MRSTIENWRNDEVKAIAHFRNRMDKAAYLSPEYRQAQRIFAWLCNKVRVKDKTDHENIT